MKKIFIFLFILYWILAIIFSQIKHLKLSLFSAIFPPDYNMMVDFPTRSGYIQYKFYGSKDTITINATELLNKNLRKNFPFIAADFHLVQSMDFDFRVIDNNFAKNQYKYIYESNNKYSSKQADSLSLVMNNLAYKNFFYLYKNYGIFFAKINNIDTKKLPNYSFKVITEPIKPLVKIKPNYYQIMGKQIVLSGNNLHYE